MKTFHQNGIQIPRKNSWEKFIKNIFFGFLTLSLRDTRLAGVKQGRPISLEREGIRTFRSIFLKVD